MEPDNCVHLHDLSSEEIPVHCLGNFLVLIAQDPVVGDVNCSWAYISMAVKAQGYSVSIVIHVSGR